MAKDKNIRFIRKNGRIIPIKTKKTDGVGPIGRANAAANAGAGIGIFAGAIKNISDDLKNAKNPNYSRQFTGMKPQAVQKYLLKKSFRTAGKYGLIGAGIGAGLGLAGIIKPIGNKKQQEKIASSAPINLAIATGIFIGSGGKLKFPTKLAAKWATSRSAIKKGLIKRRILKRDGDVIHVKFKGKKPKKDS